jgi:hypothetical protein
MASNLTLANEAQVTFHETSLCAQVDELRNEYVLYTGGIAGISDAPSSEGSAEPFDGSPDIVQLDRN